ncbi:MAG: SET domain-containing protein [Bacteroidota bacterium]|nr:SET domain-containing protein [Bacteroidota bacterium]
MNLVIKKSKIPGAGKGLFTTTLIKRGEPVIEYTGDNITWAECKRRNEHHDGVSAYFFYISARKCVDAQNCPESKARYANDAAGFIRLPGFKNNSRFEIRNGRPFIVASKNIKPGEEVYVAYGKEYWDAMRENGFGPDGKKKKASRESDDKTVHEHHLVPKREAAKH